MCLKRSKTSWVQYCHPRLHPARQMLPVTGRNSSFPPLEKVKQKVLDWGTTGRDKGRGHTDSGRLSEDLHLKCCRLPFPVLAPRMLAAKPSTSEQEIKRTFTEEFSSPTGKPKSTDINGCTRPMVLADYIMVIHIITNLQILSGSLFT